MSKRETRETEKLFSKKLDKVFAWGIIVVVVALVVRWLMNFM